MSVLEQLCMSSCLLKWIEVAFELLFCCLLSSADGDSGRQSPTLALKEIADNVQHFCNNGMCSVYIEMEVNVYTASDIAVLCECVF